MTIFVYWLIPIFIFITFALINAVSLYEEHQKAIESDRIYDEQQERIRKAHEETSKILDEQIVLLVKLLKQSETRTHNQKVMNNLQKQDSTLN